MSDDRVFPAAPIVEPKRILDSFIVDFFAGFVAEIVAISVPTGRQNPHAMWLPIAVLTFACAGFLRTRKPPVRRGVTALLVFLGGAVMPLLGLYTGDQELTLKGKFAVAFLGAIALGVGAGVWSRWLAAQKRFLAAAAVALVPALVTLLVVSRFDASPEDGMKHARMDRPMPAFVLQTLNGKPVDLQSWRGHVVVLTFWASWCGPCKAELPELERLQKDYASDSSVLILAADTGPADNDSAEKANAYLQRQHLDISSLIWAGDGKSFQQICRDYDSGIPMLFVIDQNGYVRFFESGYGTELHLEASLKTEVDQLLSH